MPAARAAAARAAYWASWRRMASPKVYSATDQGRLRGSRVVDPERSAAARATRVRRGLRAQGSGLREQGTGVRIIASHLWLRQRWGTRIGADRGIPRPRIG